MARRFQILDIPDVTEWDALKKLPRALYPIEHAPDPCTNCAGACCNQVVVVSGLEITRIAFTVRIPLHELVYAVPVAADDTVRRPEPFVLDDPQLGRGDFYLAIRRSDEGPCTFTLSPGGRVGRCGIWGIRPGNCRLYPFHIDVDDTRLRVGSERLCPTRWLQNDALRATVESDARTWLVDLARDRALVTRWNRRRKGPRDFAAYVRFWQDEASVDEGFDPAVFAPVEPRRKLGRRLY